MSYEVLVDNLRTAAGTYASIAGKVGDPVEVTHVDPSSLGHVELAAWLKAVVDQCQKATEALADGATGLSESLTSSARYYETTDDQVGQAFTQPSYGGFLGPNGSPWTVTGP